MGQKAKSATQGRQMELARLLKANPLVAVITIVRLEEAVPLARALVAGGVRALEITLRTPPALAAAKAIMQEVPDAIVGLGTVTSPRDFDNAEKLGARFAVSPGATSELIAKAAASKLPFLPGISTASELMAVTNAGFDIVKLFPAVPVGGLALLRALAGPFPSVLFCPTGGIGEANFTEWLKEPNVIAAGGSWLCPQAAVAKGDWAAITDIARRSMAKLR
jgi:2-dehydro-3-deoxyphosphogluconate aldolase/(4S)-4-hydroxy-2-oxoglutarate aldolase